MYEVWGMAVVIDAATTHYEEQFRKIAAKVRHRGKSRVEDWLMGSVPKRVSGYAPCHVIIVK